MTLHDDEIAKQSPSVWTIILISGSIAITVAVVLVLSWMQWCRACCNKLKSKLTREEETTASSSSFYTKMRQRDPHEQKDRAISFKIPNVSLVTDSEMIQDQQEPVQRVDLDVVRDAYTEQYRRHSAFAGYSLAAVAVERRDSPVLFAEEKIQPPQLLYSSPGSSPSRMRKDGVGGLHGISPAMYKKEARKTFSGSPVPDHSPDPESETQKPSIAGSKIQGKQQIKGKIWFQLFYEDQARSRLALQLHHIEDIEFERSDDVTHLYLNIFLLPERQEAHRRTSSKVERSARPVFQDKFVFVLKATPELNILTRTFVMDIYCVDKADKHWRYGEARMPMMHTEIYTAVPTDVYLRIRPVEEQEEVGDACVLLSYSHDRQELYVELDRVWFMRENILKNMTGVGVKGCLMTSDGKRMIHPNQQSLLGDVTHGTGSESPVVGSFVSSERMTFRVTARELDLHECLKMKIHGYRASKKVSTIGLVHIKNARTIAQPLGSPKPGSARRASDTGWALWHPIYAPPRNSIGQKISRGSPGALKRFSIGHIAHERTHRKSCGDF